MANLGESVPYINGKDEYQYLSNTDLVARMIYSEENGESYKGKQGCFRVYANRLYIDKSEFGRTTFNIITNQTNGFDGGGTYKTITEQHEIGNHTFFSVEGYNF